jgi:7-cyano-7-deazaguanine reductase
MKEFAFLGKKVNAPSKQLDVFSCPENITLVKFECDELTSFCPVTNQPDFYKVVLEYSPDMLCIESKSLKLYYWSFREEAMFAEALADQIVSDVYKAVQPFWCKVTITQHVRGGLQLSAVAEKRRE